MSHHHVNLASARLGAVAVRATDDFFADRARLLNDDEPVFIADRYDDNGKWMDGWESRRRRGPGHDHCIVRLARPGMIEAVEFDTRHFTGNYAPAASLEGLLAEHDEFGEEDWQTIIGTTALRGDDRRSVTVPPCGPYSHVRLNLYPDGGMARLRVFGRPLPVAGSEIVDLAASLHGGVALACNDAHYGHMGNLLLPGRGRDMGDGWETRRRRQPGFDWVIIALGARGVVERIEIDTAHFKGNYPDRCSISAALLPAIDATTVAAASMGWPKLLDESPLGADAIHVFDQLHPLGPVNCLRLDIHPDGGVSRLRAFGRPGHA